MSVRTYDFHGIGIEVDCEVDAVGDAIDGRLRHFRVPEVDEPAWRYELRIGDDVPERPAGPGRRVYEPPVGEVLYFQDEDVLWIEIEDQIRVHSARARTRVYIAESAAEEVWLLSRPLFTIPLIEALKRRGLFSLHASAVALEDRVLLLPGTTGAGKSTLSVALSRAGWEFLADDMVFLSSNGEAIQVLAFPDEVDISSESAAWFPELGATGAPADGWPKHRVRLDEAIGARIASSGAPAAIVFPEPGHEDASELHALSADVALLDLVPNVLLTDEASSQAHLDALAELVRDTPAHRLATGRDFDALSGRLAALLDRR